MQELIRLGIRTDNVRYWEGVLKFGWMTEFADEAGGVLELTLLANNFPYSFIIVTDSGAIKHIN